MRSLILRRGLTDSVLFRCGVVSMTVGLLLLSGVQTATAAHASSQAHLATPAGGVDPDTLPKGSDDAVVIVRTLGSGHYQLEVQNTSGVGFIDSFNWVAPVNLTVTAITGSEGGKCSLVGGNIQCTGAIAPPTCICSGGGTMTVNFSASGLEPRFTNGYWTYYGIVGSYLQIESMTPVPYHIGSYQSGQNVDLPICKKGQVSTRKSLCVPPG
jgi:hypothetical protein